MGLFQRTLNVDDRQKHKDKGLEKCHQNAHHHHRQRHEKRHETKEDQQDKFVAVHVAEETEGEGKGAAQVADDLNGKHDRRQPPDRSDEMLEIFEAVIPDSDHVGGEEYDECAGGGGVEVRRWREEARNQSDEFDVRMKKARVAMSGKNGLPLSPMFSTIIVSMLPMQTSMKFWSFPGTLRDA